MQLSHRLVRTSRPSLVTTVLVALSALPACSSSEDAEDASSGPMDAGPVDAVPVDAAIWTSGVVTITEEPGSAWHVTLEGSDVVARHQEADLALLVDPNNGATDDRYAGIYVTSAGTPRFDGTYNQTYCSMFVPDRPYLNQEVVSVTAAGARLAVTMTEGSLSEMADSQYPSDEPFRWESTWSLEDGGLRVTAGGLYYLLPPKDGCTLTFLGADGAQVGTLSIASDTSAFLDYFQDVRTIDLDSTVIGAISIATDAQILQVEVKSFAQTSLFEIDFDHSFKERGQLDVHTDMLLPLGE